MLKIICNFVVAVLFFVPALAQAAGEKTFYDHVQDAWAFGEIGVLAPIKYRDGQLLAFPGRITELIHARYGKPQSIYLVYEVTNAEDPAPFEKGAPFVAPLRVLPRTKYWRDNLPNTPRHEVLGGIRYVFNGDSAAAAKNLGKAYAETLGMDMPDRKLRQGEIVSGALGSPVTVLSEDSVGYLTGRTLTHITEKAAAAMVVFSAGDAPEEQRIAIIDAIGRAELDGIGPELEKLAAREDATGAAALRALAALGVQRQSADLIARSESKSQEVQAWAYRELGARAGTDAIARTAVEAVVSSKAPESVRAAACEGLGRSESDSVVETLRGAVWRGDGASRAAAMALAKIGSPSAIGVLKDAIREAPSEGMVGAVMAFVQISKPCVGCKVFLVEQREAHEDEAIRDLIGVVTQLDDEQDK